MKKRLLCILMVLALAASWAHTAAAASTFITAGLRGSDYTGIPALAAALDKVFSGQPALYADVTCSSPVPAYVGSRTVAPGRTFFVKDTRGNVYSGESCYIYANAVYSALFGDIPYHGDPGVWEHSVRVLKNQPSASWELFSSAGVSCGALLRTTANADGSYNSSRGHSVIILKYDRSSVTYLEGNGDGKGIIRVATRDWSAFNASCVSGKGCRICFVVQPTSSYYDCLRTGKVPSSSDFVGYLSSVGAPVWSDVPPSSWYASGVETVCGVGLMEGLGGGRFDPDGTITAAQAVTMAARFLSLYYDDRYSFTGGAWYQPYYDYCGLWGIDTSFASPGSPVSRADFARLMDRALPKGARTDVFTVPSFPDVPASASWAGPIYALARTGVLRGGDGLFRPGDTLTRAEAACVLARMADRSLR